MIMPAAQQTPYLQQLKAVNETAHTSQHMYIACMHDYSLQGDPRNHFQCKTAPHIDAVLLSLLQLV
jgi:hypothetical protein